MIKTALNHLHPLSNSLFWESIAIHPWCSQLYWHLDSNALLIRAFHQHPIYVWPENKNVLPLGTIDDDFVCRACPDPSSWKVITDSDEMAVFELCHPNSHHISFKKKSFFRLAFWITKHADFFHRFLAKQRVLIHSGESRSEWAYIIEESDQTIDRAIALAESNHPLFWIYFFLRRMKEISQRIAIRSVK